MNAAEHDTAALVASMAKALASALTLLDGSQRASRRSPSARMIADLRALARTPEVSPASRALLDRAFDVVEGRVRRLKRRPFVAVRLWRETVRRIRLLARGRLPRATAPRDTYAAVARDVERLIVHLQQYREYLHHALEAVPTPLAAPTPVAQSAPEPASVTAGPLSSAPIELPSVHRAAF
jgi:hypothetical protein